MSQGRDERDVVTLSSSPAVMTYVFSFSFHVSGPYQPLKKTANQDERCEFQVRRGHVLEDLLRETRNKGFCPFTRVTV